MSIPHYENRQPAPERTFLSFDQLSTGAGQAPSQHDPKVRQLIMNTEQGMITVCDHGWILREGWASLDASGQALVDLIRQITTSSQWPDGRYSRRSSLPAHCTECAQPTDIESESAA